MNDLRERPQFYNTLTTNCTTSVWLREALAKIVKELDPDNKDMGLKHMVVMGHSQGGLPTKMTVIDSGTHL
jgi:Domain of unknown function (DUF4105)